MEKDKIVFLLLVSCSVVNGLLNIPDIIPEIPEIPEIIPEILPDIPGLDFISLFTTILQPILEVLSDFRSFLQGLAETIYTLELNVELSFHQYDRVFQQMSVQQEKVQELSNTVGSLLQQVSTTTTNATSGSGQGSNSVDLAVLRARFEIFQQHFQGFATQVDYVTGQLQTLREQVAILQDTRTSQPISTYVRWGRTECPEFAQKIYSGKFKEQRFATSYCCILTLALLFLTSGLTAPGRFPPY